MKYKFRTRPDPHQLRAFKRLWKQGHLGLLWEVGTGKTKPVVDWASALFMAGEPHLKTAMIVAPLSVLGVWIDEFEKHSPLWEWGDINPIIVDKDVDDVKLYKKKLNLIVTNYDLTWRRKEFFDDLDPQLAVADESHRIKRPSTRRAVFMYHFNKVPYRAIMTGTPAPRSFLDLYGQWKFLNYKTFGTQKEVFKRKYIVYGGYRGYQVTGYTNVEDLKARVKLDASVVRQNVLDLKEPRQQRIPFKLEPSAQKAYDKLSYEMFLELKNGDVIDVKNVLAKIMKLQQVTGGFLQNEGEVYKVSNAKLNVLKELLDDRFEMGEKVVVFCRFIPEVNAVHQLGAQHFRVPTYVLHGGVKHRDRDSARKLFQSLDGPSLFVAQIQSGGLGITLHSARESIFYSVTHALEDFIQAKGRTQRRGQSRQVVYRYLVARNTIDVDMYQSLGEKTKIQDIIMGKPSVLVKYLKGRRAA